MATTVDPGSNRPTWFVGAVYSGTEDQLPRFLADGIKENGYDNKPDQPTPTTGWADTKVLVFEM